MLRVEELNLRDVILPDVVASGNELPRGPSVGGVHEGALGIPVVGAAGPALFGADKGHAVEREVGVGGLPRPRPAAAGGVEQVPLAHGPAVEVVHEVDSLQVLFGDARPQVAPRGAVGGAQNGSQGSDRPPVLCVCHRDTRFKPYEAVVGWACVQGAVLDLPRRAGIGSVDETVVIGVVSQSPSPPWRS